MQGWGMELAQGGVYKREGRDGGCWVQGDGGRLRPGVGA